MKREESFYVEVNQRCVGPLTTNELDQMLQDGSVDQRSLIWRHGLTDWQPISHYTETTVGRQDRDARWPQYAEDERNSSPVAGSIAVDTARSYVALIGSLVTAVVLFCLWSEFKSEVLDVDPPSLAMTIWICCVVLTGFVGGVFVRELWKHASRPSVRKQTQSRRGALKVVSVLGGTVIVLFLVAYLPQSVSIYRLSVAREAYSHYDLRVDPITRSISISGPIGPALGRRLRNALDTYASIDTIFITSPGGLIDEAFEAATAIYSHPEVSVYAKRECNSACIVILLSAKKRFAEATLALGFHAAAPITHLRTSDAHWESGAADQYDDFLRQHQVPEDVIERTNQIGPSKLNFVSSISLADIGTLTGVTIDNTPVSTPVAKWRLVEMMMSNAHHHDTSLLLRAVRETDQHVVSERAADLYRAVTTSDEQGVALAMREVVGPITAAAINSADPDTIAPFIEANSEQLNFLRKLELWDQCNEYATGAGVGVISNGALSGAIVEKETRALTTMILSAQANNWAVQSLPTWAGPASDEAIAYAVKNMNRQRYNARELGSNPKIECILFDEIFANVRKLDPVDGATVLRWLASRK